VVSVAPLANLPADTPTAVFEVANVAFLNALLPTPVLYAPITPPVVNVELPIPILLLPNDVGEPPALLPKNTF
jgi:hypothetical protein